MKLFKAKEDLKQLLPTDPAYPIIKRLIKLLVEDYVYVVKTFWTKSLHI